MNHDDFLSTKTLEDAITDRKKTVDGVPVNWPQILLVHATWPCSGEFISPTFFCVLRNRYKNYNSTSLDLLFRKLCTNFMSLEAFIVYIYVRIILSCHCVME